MRRGGGVLMHISSLPGPFGTGVIGQEAIDFAKQLASQGMKYWQVLPFSYPGMGNSPYQSFSAFAGNWLFIDPRRLEKRGLLTPAEVQQAEYTQNKSHVAVVRNTKIAVEEINKSFKALISRAFYYTIYKIIFFMRYYIRCKSVYKMYVNCFFKSKSQHFQ